MAKSARPSEIVLWRKAVADGKITQLEVILAMADVRSLSKPRPVREALGESEVFLAFQEELSRAAKVDRPLLIVGERGTGKELAASRVHYLSSRWNEPFVALNCAALPPSLIESELFGYEAGAFTGAGKRRLGRFETAHRGTLFLDEVGHIPLDVQSKILRAVEYQIFERVGSPEPVQVDVRIVGATNADLVRLATEGRFQRDLLDRLAFEVLVVPALRDRKGDVTLLASHFAARMAHELGWAGVPMFTDEALDALESYSWPGNVRELKNVVERAVARAGSNRVDQVVFDPFPTALGSAVLERTSGLEDPSPGQTTSGPGPVAEAGEAPVRLDTPLPDQVAALEIGLLRAALNQARFNQKKAADLLGLTYHQFRGLYRKHTGQMGGAPDQDEL
jgi:psp operon transcriptional activator